MNLGFWSCIILAPCFLLIALFFALGKESAANWLSGFNFFSEEERAKYDRKRMAADARNASFLWGVIMLLGAAASWWLSGYAAIAAYGVWLILFFRDVHWDAEKAYEKYKL